MSVLQILARVGMFKLTYFDSMMRRKFVGFILPKMLCGKLGIA
jgi:hypothetical protein